MKYLIIAPLTLGPGSVVGLTDDQAAARTHFIQPAEKKGFYEVTGTISFKAGETFIYLGDLPKALVQSVDSPNKSKNKGATKPEGDGKGNKSTPTNGAGTGGNGSADGAAGTT